MSQLLKKSDENIKACQLLIEKHQLYTASVHNAYYSSFQRSMYILQTYFPEDIPAKEVGSSHVRTINTLEQKLLDSGSSDALDFYQWINDLKRDRAHADYGNMRFDKPGSRKLLQLARKLNQLLDKANQSFESAADSTTT